MLRRKIGYHQSEYARLRARDIPAARDYLGTVSLQEFGTDNKVKFQRRLDATKEL